MPPITGEEQWGVMNFNYAPRNRASPRLQQVPCCSSCCVSLLRLLLLLPSLQQHTIAVKSPGERLIVHFSGGGDDDATESEHLPRGVGEPN